MKKYIKCDCVDTFQDEMFGKDNRLYMGLILKIKRNYYVWFVSKKVDENAVFVDEESAQ